MADDIEEIRIETLGQLVDLATPSEADPASGRLRSTAVFRGSRHVDGRLLTSLDRLGGVDPPHAKAHLEEHILRNFIRYSRPHLPHPAGNPWELLVTAQHHGVPTRLLDWSYSPLVAAHFATSGEGDADRIVWRLDWAAMHRHFGLPPFAFLVEDVGDLLRQQGVESLWELFGRPDGGESRVVCMLDPPALDARIVAQAAAFTVSADKTRSLDQVLRERGIVHLLTRYVIPAERVPSLRDQLDLVTMDERRLFPDLDGVAAQMRRYYHPTGRRDHAPPGQG